MIRTVSHSDMPYRPCSGRKISTLCILGIFRSPSSSQIHATYYSPLLQQEKRPSTSIAKNERGNFVSPPSRKKKKPPTPNKSSKSCSRTRLKAPERVGQISEGNGKRTVGSMDGVVTNGSERSGSGIISRNWVKVCVTSA